MKTRQMKVCINYLAKGEMSLVHNSQRDQIWIIDQKQDDSFYSCPGSNLGNLQDRIYAPAIEYTSVYFQRMALRTKKHPFTDRLYKTIQDALRIFPNNICYVKIDLRQYSCKKIESLSPHHQVNAIMFIYGSERAFEDMPRKYQIWNIPCQKLPAPPKLPTDLTKHIQKDTDYLQTEIRRLIAEAYECGVVLGIELKSKECDELRAKLESFTCRRKK